MFVNKFGRPFSAPALAFLASGLGLRLGIRLPGKIKRSGIEMPALGTLEVLLVNAHGLHSTDFLCNMDPYVILKWRTQEQKSKVASREGSNPEWNENFVFNISGGTSDLIIRIMDKDKLSADDFVGEATIPLEGVFMEGSIPPSLYNVVLEDKTYCGQIKVGLTFTPKVFQEESYGEEEFEGGWKQGSL